MPVTLKEIANNLRSRPVKRDASKVVIFKSDEIYKTRDDLREAFKLASKDLRLEIDTHRA